MGVDCFKFVSGPDANEVLMSRTQELSVLPWELGVNARVANHPQCGARGVYWPAKETR